MRPVNQILDQVSQKQPAEQGETTGKPLSDLDKELVNYIFHKIHMTWGEAKYNSTFSDEKTLALTKRDWAPDLISAIKLHRSRAESEQDFIFRAKSRVDDVFTEIRTLVEANPNDQRSWDWPNLKKIAGHMANYRAHAIHRPFPKQQALPDMGAKDRAKAANEKHRQAMASLFPKPPKPETDEGEAA